MRAILCAPRDARYRYCARVIFQLVEQLVVHCPNSRQNSYTLRLSHQWSFCFAWLPQWRLCWDVARTLWYHFRPSPTNRGNRRYKMDPFMKPTNPYLQMRRHERWSQTLVIFHPPFYYAHWPCLYRQSRPSAPCCCHPGWHPRQH